MELIWILILTIGGVIVWQRLKRLRNQFEATKTDLEARLRSMRLDQQTLRTRLEALEQPQRELLVSKQVHEPKMVVPPFPKAAVESGPGSETRQSEEHKPAVADTSGTDDAPKTGAAPVVTDVSMVPPTNYDWAASTQTDPPAAPSTKPAFEMDWERLLGVRGAAIMGGIVLALATVYLFRYSIEHGWISPAVRVLMGVAGSITALVIGEVLRRRDFPWPAAGSTGAGVAGLYVSLWAAHFLYGFLSTYVCFSFMILVTLGCGFLALRRNDLFVAVLGLAGGFVSPVMVTFSEFSTVELFFYLLLLNSGTLYLARRMGHPVLGALGLLATGLFQIGQLIQQNLDQNLLNTLMITAFAPMYGWPRGNEQHQKKWRLLRVIAWIPAYLLLTIAAVMLGDRLNWPWLATVLCLGAPAALFISYRHREPRITLTPVAMTLMMYGLTYQNWTQLRTTPWLTLFLVAAPALVFASVSLALPRKKDRPSFAVESMVMLFGTALLTLFGPITEGFAAPLPLLLVWTLLSGGLFIHAKREDFSYGFLGGVLIMNTGILLLLIDRVIIPELQTWQSFSLSMLALVVTALPLVLSRIIQEEKEHRHALLATRLGILPLIWFFWMTRMSDSLMATMTFAAFVIAFVGIFLSQGRGYARTVLVGFIAMSISGLDAPQSEVIILTTNILALALTILYPVLPHCRAPEGIFQRSVAYCMSPLWLITIGILSEDIFPNVSLVYPTLVVGAFPILAARFAGEKAAAYVNGWITSGAIVLVQVVPFAMGLDAISDSDWWLLQGFFLAVILGLHGQRTSNTIMQVIALLMGIPTVVMRFTTGFSVIDEGYAGLATHLSDMAWWVPLAVCVVGYQLAVRFGNKGRQHHIPAVFGLFGLVTLFAWMNLTISFMFAPDTPLVATANAALAGDLTRSLSWIVFALVIMGHGIRANQAGSRKLGLFMLMMTITKVFLYDLSTLTDLWRVAGLFGLALSLFGVSVVYRRFVKPITENT